jgi:acetyl esterase
MLFAPCRKLFALLAMTLLAACASVNNPPPESARVAHPVTVHKAIKWASPQGHDLTLDIYVPDTGKASYPVVVVFHGGGFLINTSAIMDTMSNYLASHGEYVVANMNYRLLGDLNNTVTLNQIAEDVFGGVLWVKDHIAEYKGNPSLVAVTGDSAGGHLTAMVLNSGRNLATAGFDADVPGFNPTYLPKGETAEQVAARDGLRVQAAVVSYGAFDFFTRVDKGFETDANIFWQFAGVKARGILGEGKTPKNAEAHYKAVSPLYNIPQASDYRLPPQFHHVAENDKVTTPESIQHYVNELKKAGQEVSFKIYAGRNHAFLDNGCTEVLQICFDRDAPEALADIMTFLDDAFVKASKK